MNIYEDQIMNFILHKMAESFYFIKKIGYYYTKNSASINNNIIKISGKRIKFYFIYLKFIFEYSKNNKIEKDMANFLVTIAKSRGKLNILKKLSELTFNNDFYFYYDIVNMYLNCSFISNENKLILKNYKNIIKRKRKKAK